MMKRLAFTVVAIFNKSIIAVVTFCFGQKPCREGFRIFLVVK